MRKGWEREILKRVTVFKSGKTVSKDIEKVTGEVIYAKVGDMNLEGNEENITTSTRFVDYKDIKENQIIPIGAIVFPKRGGAIATNKKRKIIKPTIVDLNTMAIGPTEKLNSEYLYYWFHSIDLQELSNGTSIPQINNNSFDNVYITYPKSLPEQQQIVAILDKAFAAIDKAKANIERNLLNAKELFQSELNQIFSQKGEGWVEKTFMQLSTRIGDGLHGTPDFDENGEYYFINGNNLNNGRIEIKENTKKINYEEFLKHKKELNDNTVLVSINGTLGNVAFYNNEPVILGKSACYINFNPEVNKHYIKYLIKSPLFFENMGNESTGATIKNFSLKSMRNYKLCLPPVNVQKEIVERLEALEEDIKTLYNNFVTKRESLNELKKAILQKAFAGELTESENKNSEIEQLDMVAE